MKRIASVFLLALLVGATWVSNAHASASYGGDCTQCHSWSNQPPVANAGVDKTANAGTAVTLSGSASRDSDDGIASYAWAQTAGTAVTLTNANTVTASFTAPNVTAATVLTFRLTVTDRRPQSATDTINVTVNPVAVNRPPVANAGADRTVNAGTGVTLSGAASSDPDDGIGSYAWTQTGGTGVTLTGANTASATFTAPTAAASSTLTFQLTVRDRANQAATDTIVVTVNAAPVNRPPVANAGVDQTVSAGAGVTLSGTASSDPDDGIGSYAWTQTGGTGVTLAGANTASATFTAPTAAASSTLTFQLTVRDRANQAATDTIAVTVNPSAVNRPPTANAGADQTVSTGAGVTLSGSASSDPDDGIGSYAWTQTGGTGVALTGANTASATFTAPNVTATTALTFQLTVRDRANQTATDTIAVTVNPAASNEPPVANAGLDQTVIPGTFVTLDGFYASDRESGIASYAWEQIGGLTVDLSNPASVNPIFQAPYEPGTLTFQLVVRDQGGLQTTDIATVVVLPPDSGPPPAPVNRPPVANAGADKAATAGTGVTLSGAASSDPDDGIASYAWTLTGGTGITLANANSVSATFTAPNVTAPTPFTFQLTVRDRANQAATDTIRVTVNPAPVNRPPVANAGTDRTVTAGAPVSLSGTASSDPDDGIASYAWTLTGGTGITLTNANSVSATFTAPNVTAPTPFTFQLTVRDRANQAATDTVVITVNPASVNRPPVANAGPDRTVRSRSTVRLSGAASTDPDDGIASYLWTQTSGTSVRLTGATTANVSFTAPRTSSRTLSLTFRLTVRDRAGQSSTDTVTVRVSRSSEEDDD